jgi:hypothetical protein
MNAVFKRVLEALNRWIVGNEAAQRRMVEEDARRLGGQVVWGDEGYFVYARKPSGGTTDG